MKHLFAYSGRSVACRLILLLVGILAPLVLSTSAQAAAAADPDGFQYSQSVFYVNENAGQAVITITRGPATIAQTAYIRYIAQGFPRGTATDGLDFHNVKDTLTFNPGELSKTFTIPIIDHGVTGVPKTISLGMFGPSSYPVKVGLAPQSNATLAILDNDPVVPATITNPLALPIAPTNGNPLQGTSFFVDPERTVVKLQRRYPGLAPIASQPFVSRFGTFSGDVTTAVYRYLTRAAVGAPGTLPLMATYRIVYGHCHNWSDPPSEVASYHDFVKHLADGIGSYRGVMFLEMDALITTGCLNAHGLTVRMNELQDAINTLQSEDPHLIIYLDAGAADALPAQRAAYLLKRAGVAKIEGFFLNATHFDWTSKEIKYGEKISQLTGGKHFVINTAVNGRGPEVPKSRVRFGNEVVCNPVGVGLGPRPTSNTGFPNVDAFAWIGIPGESYGHCAKVPGGPPTVPGAPNTGVYWPAYALGLIKRANYQVR